MSKLKFVLSDLHLGAGYGGEGGNSLEDFTADEHLVRFLLEISAESERDQCEIELIINGDFFEFLQVPAVDNYDPITIYPKQAYLDSSQEASGKRLDLIVEGHREVFEALANYMQAESPKRRITIIKGNHDVHLYWPLVKSRLREVLGASGPRASLLLFAAEFISRERIYVEHGHQRAEKINCYHDFHDPRLPDDPLQLYYPPGSHFLVDFINEVERERWFVDSVKPLTALNWFALHWDFDFAARMLASLVRHTTAPAGNNSTSAGEITTSSDLHTLLNRLEDQDERRRLSQRYTGDPAFRKELHQQIWPYLNEVGKANSSFTTSDQAEIHSDPLTMGRTAQVQQQMALQQAAEKIIRQEKAEVILFGHSHQPVYEQLYGDGIYINTGCWLGQQDLSAVSPETWEALFTGSSPGGDRPIRLPYARIDYDEDDRPRAQLLDFANKNTTPQKTGDKSNNLFTRLLNRFSFSSAPAAI